MFKKICDSRLAGVTRNLLSINTYPTLEKSRSHTLEVARMNRIPMNFWVEVTQELFCCFNALSSNDKLSAWVSLSWNPSFSNNNMFERSSWEFAVDILRWISITADLNQSGCTMFALVDNLLSNTRCLSITSSNITRKSLVLVLPCCNALGKDSKSFNFARKSSRWRFS